MVRLVFLQGWECVYFDKANCDIDYRELSSDKHEKLIEVLTRAKEDDQALVKVLKEHGIDVDDNDAMVIAYSPLNYPVVVIIKQRKIYVIEFSGHGDGQ